MNLTIENLEKLKGFGKKKKFINKHKLLPQFPFNLCISGPTGCGKGVLLLNLILKFIHFDRLYLATKHIDQPQVQMLVKFFVIARGEDIRVAANSSQINTRGQHLSVLV